MGTTRAEPKRPRIRYLMQRAAITRAVESYDEIEWRTLAVSVLVDLCEFRAGDRADGAAAESGLESAIGVMKKAAASVGREHLCACLRDARAFLGG